MYENLTETELKSELMYDGRLLHVYKDTVSLPNGNTSTREYIKHNGASCVVPILSDGTVFVEKQFRYPFHAVMTEIPAGKLDLGESPEAAARRELREETGITGANLRFIGEILPSVAYTTESIFMYIATDLEFGQNSLDEDEFLIVEKIHIDELFNMIMSGQIRDSKTQTAIMKTYYLYHEGKLF